MRSKLRRLTERFSKPLQKLFVNQSGVGGVNQVYMRTTINTYPCTYVPTYFTCFYALIISIKMHPSRYIISCADYLLLRRSNENKLSIRLRSASSSLRNEALGWSRQWNKVNRLALKVAPRGCSLHLSTRRSKGVTNGSKPSRT